MKRVDALLADYGSHHRTRGNRICHVFGVTLIVFGMASMLGRIQVGAATAAEVVMTAAVLYYSTLDLALAAAMLVTFALIDLASRALADWRVGVAAFAVGWVFQAVGHAVYEKNRPAFFKNLAHLLVGPLFLMNELLRIRRPAAAEPSR
ncbi:MAG TPA: Mpo1-like protein [Thermoanaerobaculia bacterium]|jgi:uncharacterized membrane protein YGL010W|nr:Mpo1-like protein [Thermoanaerobaculia bacterium]